jgi:ABC-type transport system involved in multi-copper enzyme maturation permease subunit
MNWFSPVWLVTKRELRDQLRDWRILFPLLLLTILFPILMNEVAKAAVNFVSQYGETILVDRLVPFSVLIIGFFPITISLVVALESFVGEKERGTIEPLLTTPLLDWHMYLGKLIIGVLTPLTASMIAITFYLIIVSYQKIEMPEISILIQLLALTCGHAILMVSAAIVISVQSTSVKAANLLASFIVIPVAILMQGESALLFWGNNQVLWLAVVGVLILAGSGAFSAGVSTGARDRRFKPAVDVEDFFGVFDRFFEKHLELVWTGSLARSQKITIASRCYAGNCNSFILGRISMDCRASSEILAGNHPSGFSEGHRRIRPVTHIAWARTTILRTLYIQP